MEKLRQRVRAGMHFTVLNRLVVSGVPAIIALAAVRVVPTAEFGLYNVLLALSGLVGKLTSLGWPETIARYVPRLDAAHDRERLAGFLLQALAWRFVVTAAVAGAMVAGFSVLAPIFKLYGSERAFLLFAATVVFTTQNFLLTASVESLLLQRVLFAIGAVTSLVQIAFMTVFFVRGGNLVALMWMELSRTVLFYLLAAYFVFRAVGGGSWWRALQRRRPFVDATAARYRWYSLLNDMSQELLSPRSDYLLLSYLTSAVQVAVYAVPTRIIRIVEMFVPTTLLKGPVESAFYRAYERERTPVKLNAMFQTLAKINLTAIGVILAISLVYAHTVFVRIFGASYEDAGTIFTIFIIVMALYYYPIGIVLKALERMDLILWAKLTIALHFLLAVFFVRWWGAVGMAVATTITLLTKNVIVYRLTRRAAGVRMPWAAILRIMLNVAASWAIMLGIRSVLGETWPAVLAGIAAGTLTYALLTLVNSGYSAGEIQLFADMLPRRIGDNRLARALFGLLRTRAQAASVVPAP